MENLTIADKLLDLDAEKNACETRAALLQVESEQVRARIGEIDDDVARGAACARCHAAIAKLKFRPRRSSCSPMQNIWHRPA